MTHDYFERRAREWLDAMEDGGWTEGTYISLAALLAEVAEETRERCAREADRMLGNPSPDAWPNVRDAEAWNGAVLRTAASIRALKLEAQP